MNAVVVDWDVCYPTDSGKRLRTLNLMLELAGRHNLTYISRGDGDSPAGRTAKDFLESRGIATVFAGLGVPKKKGLSFYGRLAANLASRSPYAVTVHHSLEFRRLLHDYAAKHSVDVWQVEWSPYVDMLGGIPGAKTLLMAHNVDSLIWQRYCETETRPAVRAFLNVQWRRFERYERRIFRAATRVVAVSPDDARLMRERFAAPAVDVVENGVDLPYYQLAPVERDPRELLFLGSLDWRPNVDGIRGMLDDVLPRIVAAEPSVRLTVVGRNPSPQLAARLRQTPGCELHADVPDVRPYLAKAGMMVVPLRIGGGSRLKILEAAASRLPVVSTTVGAEGLQFQAGRDLAIADDPEALARAVVHGIRSPSEAAQRAELAWNVVSANYSWTRLAGILEGVWQQVASTAPPLAVR